MQTSHAESEWVTGNTPRRYIKLMGNRQPRNNARRIFGVQLFQSEIAEEKK